MRPRVCAGSIVSPILAQSVMMRHCRRSASHHSGDNSVSSSSSTMCDLKLPKIVGNQAVGVRDNMPYIYERREFIGRFTPLVRPRTDAGEVLALIDSCAGRAAVAYLSAKIPMGGTFEKAGDASLATISFNSFTFSQPVFEGDLISVQSRVIHAGESSLGVHARVLRQAFDCPDLSIVGESYVTMVAVNRDDITVPYKGLVPAVRLTEGVDVLRHARYLEMRRQTAALANIGLAVPSSLSDIEMDVNKTKQEKSTIAATAVKCHHIFDITDMNANDVIFGGEVLRFMEKTALHCGRVFARKARLFTLAMLGMTFESPVFLQDLAKCEARVLCVRRSTLLVTVRIEASNAQDEQRTTNEASFILVAADEKGVPFEITRGIDLTDASKEDLTLYWGARMMMEHSYRTRSRPE